MWRSVLVTISWVSLLSAADLATPRAAQIAAGSISSTAAVMIDGTLMARSAAPSWPLVDRDEIGTTSAPAQLRTLRQNSVTLQSETIARIRTPQTGELFVYLRSGALTFDIRANGVSVCAQDRLYIPAMPAKGALKLSKSGMVTVSGRFAEVGQRSCNEDGFIGLLTALTGAGAAGGTAISAGAGAAAAGGTAATVAGAVAVGSAGAAGLATAAGASGCPSAAGCNFNATAISSSAP